jgi:hypothetical protein
MTDSVLTKRFLGPTRPELTCEQCFDELDRYVELELDGIPADTQVPGMRAHLEGCPACAEDHDSLLAFVATSSSAPGRTCPVAIALQQQRPGGRS